MDRSRRFPLDLFTQPIQQFVDALAQDHRDLQEVAKPFGNGIIHRWRANFRRNEISKQDSGNVNFSC